jgi:hypothetical protein
MKFAIGMLVLLILSAVGHAGTLEDVGGFGFSVRAATTAELPKDTSGEILEWVRPGLAFGALGLAAPPMYASGLVVGGLLLGPGALIAANIEHATWRHVADALGAIDFDQATLRALERRGALALPTRPGRQAKAELVINAYGIVGHQPGRVCFIADTELRVQVEQHERLRQRILLTDAAATPEQDAAALPPAPPAQCASIDRFARTDAQLVRDTAAEYAELLAALVIERLVAEVAR